MYQYFLKGCKLFHHYLVIVVCLFAVESYCQPNPKVDSLKQVLPHSDGINKFNVLFLLAYEEFYDNPQEASEFAEAAYKLAPDVIQGDSLPLVKSGRILGQLLTRIDRVNESIKVLAEVFPISKRHAYHDETKKISNSLAIAYTFTANFDEALRYNYESLLIREKQGSKREISASLNNIGLVYYKLRNYKKAIEFYQRGIAMKNEIGDVVDLERFYINLGLCYNQIGDFESSLECFEKGLSICTECNEQILLEGKYGLGQANLGLKNFAQSEAFFNESLALARKVDDRRFQAENLLSLGEIYGKTNRDTLALKVLSESESLASHHSFNDLLVRTYSVTSEVYNKRGDFPKEAEYQRKYITVKDSIFSGQLIENLTKVQTEFAERENRATIASKNIVIKQQRDLNFAVAVIAILAGLFVLALQRSNRIIKRVNAQLSEAKEVIQEQNKLLESKNKYLDREVESKTEDLERANHSLKQVNDELDNFIYKTSHDIRGPLASLKGMCNVALMDVKDPIAIDYLRKLDTTAERLNTILTRLLIINQINNSKLSVARVDFEGIVSDVLLLEKKKGLPKKLSVKTDIHPSVFVQSDRELIRTVLENLIGNAIKFYNDSERIDSFVNIHVIPMEEGQVRVRIIDNGIGISESNPGKLFRMFFRASERSETGGIGLYIVKTAMAKLGGSVGLLTTPEGYTEFYAIFPAHPPQGDEIYEKAPL